LERLASIRPDLDSTYQCVLLEDFLTLRSQFHRQDGNLPSIITSTHFDTQRSSEDLMSEAHTDDTDAVLLEQLLREIDKVEDPWIVVV
jgi:hypothetical protein